MLAHNVPKDGLAGAVQAGASRPVRTGTKFAQLHRRELSPLVAEKRGLPFVWDRSRRLPAMFKSA